MLLPDTCMPRDGVTWHELKLSFHIAREQVFCIWSEFKKTAVK